MPRGCRCSFPAPMAAESEMWPRFARHRAMLDFRGLSFAAIASIARWSGRSGRSEWSGCGCGYARDTDFDELASECAGAELLQPIHGVHHALKLRAIEQIESAFFAGKHFQRQSPGRGYHSRR